MRRSLSMYRETVERRRLGALLYPPAAEPRPATRADCESSPRPCPWVSCRHHLHLDVDPRGNLKLAPEGQPGDSCALDVAEQGGATLEEVGELLGGLTRERVRQIEQAALAKVRRRGRLP